MQDTAILTIISLIIGAFAGYWINVAVAWKISHSQFLSSIAGHRINMTVKATVEIINSPRKNSDQRSRLRDKYRYSLGVIIDILERSFGKDAFSTEGPWPCLTEVNKENLTENPLKNDKGEDIDRWRYFDNYVRPVVQDINSYSFIGKSRWLRLSRRRRETINQLDKLTQLCNQLEVAVSVLDAALEQKSLVEFYQEGSEVMIKPKLMIDGEEWKDHEKGVVRNLIDEYNKLHAAWIEWLRVSNL